MFEYLDVGCKEDVVHVDDPRALYACPVPVPVDYCQVLVFFFLSLLAHSWALVQAQPPHRLFPLPMIYVSLILFLLLFLLFLLFASLSLSQQTSPRQ